LQLQTIRISGNRNKGVSVKSHLMIASVLTAFAATAAHAEANPFGYSYTADVEEPGETELSLWATDRRGKNDGHYDAQDYRLEVERGITDRFQIAGYANLASHHVRPSDPSAGRIDRDFAFQGLSVEFKYKLLDEKKHGFGLAVYAEPAWSRIHKVEGEKGTEYELEFKLIASKSWLGERLLWAGNLTFEPEWEKEREEIAPGIIDSEWEKELKLEATTGVAYRFAPNWTAGVEARYASVYPDWTEGLHRGAYAIFAGPMIAFDKHEWSASLTVLPQIAGGPGAGNRNLDEYEKSEVRLKISREF
jgi:hypothetical protein